MLSLLKRPDDPVEGTVAKGDGGYLTRTYVIHDGGAVMVRTEIAAGDWLDTADGPNQLDPAEARALAEQLVIAADAAERVRRRFPCLAG